MTVLAFSRDPSLSSFVSVANASRTKAIISSLLMLSGPVASERYVCNSTFCLLSTDIIEKALDLEKLTLGGPK